MHTFSVGVLSHGAVSPLGSGKAQFKDFPEIGKTLSILLTGDDSWASYKVIDLNLDQSIDGEVPQVIVEKVR